MPHIELMVTVKAYPSASRKEGEAVCVAGVRADTTDPEWVRLWPIPFRELPFDARFKKYALICLEARRPGGADRRPETRRPNVDSLQVLSQIGTENGTWQRRRALVEPLELDSMCEIRRRQKLDLTSLGAFQPADIELLITRDDEPWNAKQQAILNRPSLFFPSKQALEKIPYRFLYRYKCGDRRCRGHEQSIIDWEIAQAYRNWRRGCSEQELLVKIRSKWIDQMFASDRDTRLFVGNQHQNPEGFLVLGVFWPRKVR